MRLVHRPVASIALLALAACGGSELLLPNEGQPANVAMISGDRQTAAILAPAPDSLVVRVTDRFNTPVPNVEIVWAADGGGDVSPATMVTGADGRAAAQRLLGAEPGTYGTTAVAPALPEDVVTFITTALASRLVLLTQPGANATSGAVIAPQPVLQLQDPSGSPLARAGVSVTAQIASGGGTIQGSTSRTSDANGTVTYTDLAIAGSPGARTLIFAAAGYAPATSTPVSLTPGAPSAERSTVAVAPGSIPASSGSAASEVSVTVRDNGGNPLPGQSVTLSATGSGVELTQPGVTDASGATTGRFTATAAGDHVVTALTGGVTLGTTTVTVTPGATVASRTTVEVPGGTAGAPTVVRVGLRDEFGNGVGGGAGRIAVVVSGPNASGGLTVVEQAGGNYEARYTPLRIGADQVDVRLDGQPVTGSPFTSVVAPGASDAGGTTADVPDGSFAVPLIILVHVNDAQGNSVGRGGDLVEVSVRDLQNGTIPVEYVADGVYRAVWTPFVLGSHQVDIRLNGAAISGSPFDVFIRLF